MSADLQPRHQAESRTEMTEYVLPQHANALGNVFGGQVMAWVDLCGAICAQRHTSMEIEISVWGEEPTTRKRWVCVTARLTFVAIDKGRKPTPIPALVIDSEAVRESQAAGVARRTERLAKKTPTTV